MTRGENTVNFSADGRAVITRHGTGASPATRVPGLWDGDRPACRAGKEKMRSIRRLRAISTGGSSLLPASEARSARHFTDYRNGVREDSSVALDRGGGEMTTTSIGTLLAVVTCGLIGVTFTLLVVTLGGLALKENEYEDCLD